MGSGAMHTEQQKTVVLGVTGCIAAYKSAEIVRGLQKAGVRVKVVMTEHACEFVGPTTFRALTREPVAVKLFDEPGDPIHHISLAQEADAMLIAPCTANVLAKLACGIADDLLTTTALALTSPLVIAPAMNVHMYENPATRNNMGVLHIRGAHFIEADDGYLACGEVGKGRLADVDEIVAQTLKILGTKRDLAGRRMLVTAGPTVEAIDPVRYISNRSSGKMGYEIARAAQRRGAEVTLVSGPTALAVPEGVHAIPVESAQEMLACAQEAFAGCDIAVFAAAVSDMRPKDVSPKKLKKGSADAELSSIELVENPDILRTLAASKENQVVVGFAAETHEVLENAKEKLVRKNADLIVANDVSGDIGFGTDENKVWIVSAEGVADVPLLAKSEIADIVLDRAAQLLVD